MIPSSLEFPTHVGSSPPAFPRTLPPYLGAVLVRNSSVLFPFSLWTLTDLRTYQYSSKYFYMAFTLSCFWSVYTSFLEAPRTGKDYTGFSSYLQAWCSALLLRILDILYIFCSESFCRRDNWNLKICAPSIGSMLLTSEFLRNISTCLSYFSICMMWIWPPSVWCYRWLSAHVSMLCRLGVQEVGDSLSNNFTHRRSRFVAFTDLLFLHYKIWCTYSRTVCGYIFEGSSSNLFNNAFVYLIMTLILNVLLTGLTGGYFALTFGPSII